MRVLAQQRCIIFKRIFCYRFSDSNEFVLHYRSFFKASFIHLTCVFSRFEEICALNAHHMKSGNEFLHLLLFILVQTARTREKKTDRKSKIQKCVWNYSAMEKTKIYGDKNNVDKNDITRTPLTLSRMLSVCVCVTLSFYADPWISMR